MQKFNDGLKELCELAGFNDRTLIVEQYMGRKARLEKYYVEKFKVVSSHCCRRSFATNLYRMGYQLSQIMPMTGHSTESQLRQYIGIDNEQNAESIGLDILRTNENQSQYANGYLRMVK
jgi:integrase